MNQVNVFDKSRIHYLNFQSGNQALENNLMINRISIQDGRTPRKQVTMGTSKPEHLVSSISSRDSVNLDIDGDHI